MNFMKVTDGHSREFHEVGELQNYLDEHGIPESAEHSRLFSYSDKTHKDFLESISAHFCTNLNNFDAQLLGIQGSNNTFEGVAQLWCSCPECETEQGKCERRFMVANFEYLEQQGPATLGRSLTIGGQGSRVGRRANFAQPHRVIQDRGNIVFERERPEDNTTFQLRRMSFQFLQRLPPMTRLETFTVGQDTARSGTTQTCPSTYMAIHIQDMCDAWDILMGDSKSMMSPINRQVSTEGIQIKKELVLRLFHTLDVWEEMREIHRNQVASLGFLKSYIGNECWFRNTTRAETHGGDAEFLRLQQALRRLDAIGIDSLVLDTNALISKTYNLISIDEAYRSRKQNTSIKRLTWIAFIFLPLLFIASLYGMNVDLTASNPAFTTFFYFAIPLLVFLIICVAIMKNFRRICHGLEALKKHVFQHGQPGTEDDFELQNLTASAIDGTTDASPLLSWVAERRTFNAEFPTGFGNAGAMETAFLEAAAAGHMKMVERLLMEGANVNARSDNNRRTALEQAAEGGHLEVVERLLREERSDTPNSALGVAAECGHLEVVERLLREERSEKIDGVLVAASGGGHLEVVERLLREERSDNLNLALRVAARQGHLEVVERLLMESSAMAGDALIGAAGGGQLEVVERLLKGRIGRDSVDEALVAAALQGHSEMVERLLDAGADKNTKAGYCHETAVEAATRVRNWAVVRILDLASTLKK